MTTATLLTGAASGIGRHLTGLLAAEDRPILATDVGEAGLARAAAEEGWGDAVRTRVLDVRDASAWDAAVADVVAAHGRLDLVLNVAGVIRPAHIEDVTDADLDLQLDVNLRGVIYGTRAAARQMLAQDGGGHIVNFGSLASLAPVPGLTIYSASKFAVRGFSLAAALDLRDKGVAVTVVLPDAVQTPMLDEQVGQDAAALTFSGPRPLTVEEVGRAVVDRVLPKRPLEVALPWSRAAMARTGGLWPGVAARLEAPLRKRGQKAQAQRRR